MRRGDTGPNALAELAGALPAIWTPSAPASPPGLSLSLCIGGRNQRGRAGGFFLGGGVGRPPPLAAARAPPPRAAPAGGARWGREEPPPRPPGPACPAPTP